jgi:hypothetical protein
MCRDAYATFDHRPWCRWCRSTTTTSLRSCSTARRWRSRTSPATGRSTVRTRAVATGPPDHDRRSHDRATPVGAIDGVQALRPRRHRHPVPEGRTSEVQRRQMTTVESPNVHVVAIDGSFDDCQDLVKAMFADADFRDGWMLSAVNSINWARVMAQVVYYVTATDHLRGDDRRVRAERQLRQRVSGWIAKQMGRRSAASSSPPTPTTSSPGSSTTTT